MAAGHVSENNLLNAELINIAGGIVANMICIRPSTDSSLGWRSDRIPDTDKCAVQKHMLHVVHHVSTNPPGHQVLRLASIALSPN